MPTSATTGYFVVKDLSDILGEISIIEKPHTLSNRQFIAICVLANLLPLAGFNGDLTYRVETCKLDQTLVDPPVKKKIGEI